MTNPEDEWPSPSERYGDVGGVLERIGSIDGVEIGTEPEITESGGTTVVRPTIYINHDDE